MLCCCIYDTVSSISRKKNYQLTVLLGNNTILLPTMEVVNLLALGSLVVVAQHVWELVKQDLEAKAILFTFICLADILKRVNFTKLQQSASLFQKTTRTLYHCLRKLQTSVHGPTCQLHSDPFSYVRLTGRANHKSCKIFKQRVRLVVVL